MKQFGEVTWRNDKVLVLAQGPSFAAVDLDRLWLTACRGVTLVAVNGAIDHVPWADFWFTLDPSPENRARMEARRSNAIFVAAVPNDFGDPKSANSDFRKPAPGGVVYLQRLAREDGRGPFKRRVLRQFMGGLSEDPSAIHTGNSAFGALGLAYHMRPRIVGFLGLDGHGRRRWDGSKNLDLDHLPLLFADAVPQLHARSIVVLNGSPGSAITCFPQLSPNETMGILEDWC